MFRPIPKATLFRRIPYRLITSVVLILALVVTVILLMSLERDKLLLQGFTQNQAVPTELFQALWRSRHDLIGITLLVFLVSAIGMAALITFLFMQGMGLLKDFPELPQIIAGQGDPLPAEAPGGFRKAARSQPAVVPVAKQRRHRPQFRHAAAQFGQNSLRSCPG